MGELPRYQDRRAGFWKLHFENGLTYKDSLERADPEKARKWAAMEERIPALTDEQRGRLAGHGRTLHVLFYSGVWCGDCVRQGPMIRRIVEACGPSADLRIVERGDSEELGEELRVLGGLRVPVAVFLSEDFYEVARFGDRTLAAYRAKALREVGPACDAGLPTSSPEQLRAELEEWVAIFERALLMMRLAPQLRERHQD